MKLLIVAATIHEINPILPFLEAQQIPFLITEVGMTATAYALGKYLQHHQVDLIINVGIAGAFNKEIPLGAVMEIVSDAFVELGAEDHDDFISIDKLGFGKGIYEKKGMLSTDLQMVQAATVNRIHGNDKNIQRIQALFPNITLESMEGAAIFYVCEKENLSCIQVRAVSNYVEKRNKDNWDIPLAIKNLNNWLHDFLKKLE